MKTKLTLLVILIASVIATKILFNAHSQIQVNTSALAEVVDAS